MTGYADNQERTGRQPDPEELDRMAAAMLAAAGEAPLPLRAASTEPTERAELDEGMRLMANAARQLDGREPLPEPPPRAPAPRPAPPPPPVRTPAPSWLPTAPAASRANPSYVLITITEKRP